MQELANNGFGSQQIATTLELLVADRQFRLRMDDHVDLVTTGPEARGVANRDTSVVVRELFADATESVLVAGFAIYQGQMVFQALADRMQEKPQLRVRMFVDIQRPFGDTTSTTDLIRRFADRFRNQQWPQDRPLPAVFFDPRSLDASSDKRTCMHAKCVVVDRRSVFVSSANFTEAAQQRNIEVGVLIHSTSVADRLTRFFDSMQDEGLLAPVF
jgi:phosphatidylserine/phosphatidylglycerophosphate/cardiolipin synthase-like enzyme